MGCEKPDNGLTELVASDEWCARAALTARFHKHAECERVCACALASEGALETPYFTHWFKDFLSMQRETARAVMNKLVTDTHTCAATRSTNLHSGPSWGFSPSLLKNAPQSRSIKIGPVQHTGHITHTHSRSHSGRPR